MDTGPANSIMGDLDEPVNLPQTQVDEEVLNEEKKLAKYSKTAEFKRLKEYMENRIKFFQSYLPDGKEVRFADVKDPSDITVMWIVANNIILEFNNLLAEYENAKQVVKDA